MKYEIIMILHFRISEVGSIFILEIANQYEEIGEKFGKLWYGSNLIFAVVMSSIALVNFLEIRVSLQDIANN